MSTICNGKSKVTDRTINDICREFHVREEWLRTGEGDMYASDSHATKINRFFADVLSTAPDARSAFVAALADLPPEFYPMVAQLAREIVSKLGTEKED